MAVMNWLRVSMECRRRCGRRWFAQFQFGSAIVDGRWMEYIQQIAFQRGFKRSWESRVMLLDFPAVLIDAN